MQVLLFLCILYKEVVQKVRFKMTHEAGHFEEDNNV